MDILTVNLFPLISQLLMISDETVQQEGISSMLKICKEDILPREEGCFLMHNVLQILYKKCDGLESAQVGALMLLEAFVKEGLFGQDEVKHFMSEHFSSFVEERLFKIRRPFLKCLITVSKHLSREEIGGHVFNIYKVCSQPSEVWGLRRYCLELAPDLV